MKVSELDRMKMSLFVIEICLWVALVYLSSHREVLPMIKSIVQTFHILSLSVVAFAWIAVFGHGRPSVGDLSMWHQAFWVLVLVLQLVLVAVALKLFRRWRARRR